jgi:hypothetical protein
MADILASIFFTLLAKCKREVKTNGGRDTIQVTKKSTNFEAEANKKRLIDKDEVLWTKS